ncbi:GSCOCG00006076001-RA-CDS [Cotesia congregata]|nr:GSCOCG00006076001-RA-CDS [Cotesia congregata]
MASIKIDPLTADNYDTWKVHMRAILKKNYLWEYVSGETPRPGVAELDKLREWKKMDGKAESDTLLAISASELRPYAGLGSSKAVWDKLKENFESRGATRISTLLKKCINTKMDEGADVRKHVTEFCETAKKLKETDIDIPDQMLVMLLLSSLPESYAVFKETIESRDELPKLDALMVKLFDRQEGKMMDAANGQGALYSKNYKTQHDFSKKPRHGQERREKIVCHSCGKEGHIARKCRTTLQPKNKYKPRANQSESPSEKHENSMLGTVGEVLYAKNNGEWCLDSGCTSHMCNQKNMFKSFEHTNSELSLANSECAKITGIGSVELRAHNGDVNLKNVLYVSDLRTNLLSVAKTTDHDYKVTFWKDKALITSGDKVILRAKRRGNLYFIQKDNYAGKRRNRESRS